MTKVDVLVSFLSIRRNGNGTGVADGGFAQGALMEILTDWPDDLRPELQDACSELELGFGNADPFLLSNQRLEAMGAKPIAL